jgi:hypothetical protein
MAAQHNRRMHFTLRGFDSDSYDKCMPKHALLKAQPISGGPKEIAVRENAPENLATSSLRLRMT